MLFYSTNWKIFQKVLADFLQNIYFLKEKLFYKSRFVGLKRLINLSMLELSYRFRSLHGVFGSS